MKSLIILISLFCFSSLGLAQDSLSLFGTVTSAEDGQSIPMAKVMATNGENKYYLLTDLDGKFRFSNLPAGEYDLHVRTIGYDTALIKAITIESQKAVEVAPTMNKWAMSSCCMGCVFGPLIGVSDPAVPK